MPLQIRLLNIHKDYRAIMKFVLLLEFGFWNKIVSQTLLSRLGEDAK